MKSDEIENRDKELIKKFRTIIRNKKPIEEKPAPKSLPFGLIFLLPILIISCLFFLKGQPGTLFSQESKAPSHGEPVPEKQPVPSIPTEEIEPPDTPKRPTPTPEVVERSPAPKSFDSVLSTPSPETKSPEEISDQKEQGDIPSEIRIKEIISCSEVNNRQYDKPKREFSLAESDAPKIWMEVISENPPLTLTHVYYCNGQKYCDVPLAIRYHRVRTWSTVTLRSLDQIGQWRVEVIDENGLKLDQIEFCVEK